MHTVIEGEHGSDLVARDRTHRFGRDASVAAVDLPAVIGDMREDPARIAGKEPHQIEQMRTQHRLLQDADFTGGHYVPHAADNGQGTHHEADFNLDVVLSGDAARWRPLP